MQIETSLRLTTKHWRLGSHFTDMLTWLYVHIDSIIPLHWQLLRPYSWCTVTKFQDTFFENVCIFVNMSQNVCFLNLCVVLLRSKAATYTANEHQTVVITGVIR